MYVMSMPLSTPNFITMFGVALLAFKLSMAEKNAQSIGVTSVFHVRVHVANKVSMAR